MDEHIEGEGAEATKMRMKSGEHLRPAQKQEGMRLPGARHKYGVVCGVGPPSGGLPFPYPQGHPPCKPGRAGYSQRWSPGARGRESGWLPAAAERPPGGRPPRTRRSCLLAAAGNKKEINYSYGRAPHEHLQGGVTGDYNTLYLV